MTPLRWLPFLSLQLAFRASDEWAIGLRKISNFVRGKICKKNVWHCGFRPHKFFLLYIGTGMPWTPRVGDSLRSGYFMPPLTAWVSVDRVHVSLDSPSVCWEGPRLPWQSKCLLRGSMSPLRLLVYCMWWYYYLSGWLVLLDITLQGHMQWLFDHTGRRYLDLFSGIVTVSVGHSHP